jgi:YbgC/YbaW family acyl-CoA thioester hydrolase
MKREEFRFAERLRVRWAEIDAQQIVFNGHYLMYFDTAIAGYWRALALPYQATMVALEGDLYVRKATVEYLGSARYDDIIDIGVRCTRVGTSSMLFACGVFRQGRLLVSGELVYVFADPATQTAKPIPQALRSVLDSFERGDSMFELRLGSWGELGADARRIRSDVFLAEQKIPAELEWDTADADALHAVAYNRLGMPLGTGRLLTHGQGVARMGRMAVLAPMRGGRIGRALLEALTDAARQRGASEAVLHAQLSAAAFYARAGYIERGAKFEEAGIAHVEMARAL